MKTIREWLEELPEPYRTQAINNTSESVLMVEEESLSEAVTGAFSWWDSPEGLEYWSDFYDTLKD